ncbi:uncharacterized protein TRIVIDRAFT_53295, partial [Trichoderma virens Gv29-8]
ISLEKSAIQLTSASLVKVDEQLRTTVDGIYAVGDCAENPYFTHIGFDDFRVAISQLNGSAQPCFTKNRQVLSVLFTSHKLAHVGLREKYA